MGLQHAIEDIHREPEDEAAAVEAESGATTSASGSGLRERLFARAGGVLEKLRGGRAAGPLPLWKILAIGIVAYVALINGSYFLVVKPMRSRIQELLQKKATIEDFLVARESSTAAAHFKDALMRGDQRVTVITEIEDVARKAGLQMDDEPVLLPDKAISKRIHEFPIQLSLKGSYHEVGEFLALLESSPRALVVRQVELDARDGGPDRGTVTIIVSAVSWDDGSG